MRLIRQLAAAATLLVLGTTVVRAAEAPGVAVIYDSPWAPGDASRAGAAEFSVLLKVAQLRQAHPLAGVVAVGYRRGLLQPATEDALNRASLMGVAVVRLAEGADKFPSVGGNCFVEVGAQAASSVEKILADCLALYGAPPAVANPARPTARELAAIHKVISRYQFAFDAAQGSKMAALAMGPRTDYEN
jgi:hypothetical protein